MKTDKKPGFSNYAAAPLMVVIGFTIASLVFAFILKEPSPVPVFIVFAVIQAGSMSMFALLPGRGKRVARMVSMFLMGTMLFVLVGALGRTNIQIEGFFLLPVFRGHERGDCPLHDGQSYRAHRIWPQLVRLGVLDGDDSGSSAV